MDEIMNIIYKYSPMNGACNKIMKQSIHDYETEKEKLWNSYMNIIPNPPSKNFETFFKNNYTMKSHFIGH